MVKEIPCALCGTILRRRDRIKSISFCNGSCRALYYARNNMMRQKPKQTKEDKQRSTAGPLLPYVKKFIETMVNPRYIHRDTVWEYLSLNGYIPESMSEILIKRSLSASLSLQGYERVSPASNAYINRSVPGVETNGDRQNIISAS